MELSTNDPVAWKHLSSRYDVMLLSKDACQILVFKVAK